MKRKKTHSKIFSAHSETFSTRLFSWGIIQLIKLPDFIFEIFFFFAYFLYAFLHTDRAWGRTLRHLRACGFTKEKVKVRDVFRNLFFNEIDSLRFLTETKIPRSKIENEALFVNALRENRPIIAIGIHQGAFEILPRTLLTHAPKVHLITASSGKNFWEKILRLLRKKRGLREHDAQDAAQAIKQVIREKSVLSLAIDQSKSTKGTEVLLFRKPSPLFLRLPLLANRLGASILTFRTYREKNIHIVRFETLYRAQKNFPAGKSLNSAGDFSNSPECKSLNSTGDLSNFPECKSLNAARSSKNFSDKKLWKNIRFENKTKDETPLEHFSQTFLIEKIAGEVERWITNHPEQWTWNYHRNFSK